MADDTYSRGYRNDPPGRRDTGAAGSDVDPLTELARLIGQSDPFIPADQRRPAFRDSAPSAPSRDWAAQPPSYEAGSDDHAQYPAEDAHDRAEQQVAADQGYGYADGSEGRSYGDHAYEDDHAGEDNGAGYDDDPAGGHPPDRRYDDVAPAPRRRGPMRTVAALIGVAIIGAVLAFAYRAVFTPGTPPLIARDRGPNKIVASSAEARSTKGDDRIPPADQSDRMVPHERMVSHEERPITLPDGTPSAPGFGQSGAATLPGPMQPLAPADVASAGPAAPDGAAPRKVQTVTIPADGAASGPTAAPPRTASRAGAAGAAQPAAQPAPLQIAPRPPATPSPPPEAGGPPSRQVATAAPPAPRAAARAEAGSGYYVQVSAQRSEEEAQSSFRGIQEKYENLLGGQEPVIRRKDLGSKGIFFGAQVGPFSRESAVSLCENLKTAGGSCMVQKN